MSNALQKQDIFSILNSNQTKGKLARLLPQGTRMDRFLQICFNEIRANPKLLNCRPESIVDAIGQTSRLGLDIGGTLGHAYLVPYGQECQFIIGYKGLKELAYRTGKVLSIEARTIYEHDFFEIEYGTNAHMIHKPTLVNQGRSIGYSAMATLENGTKIYGVLTMDDINRIKKNIQGLTNPKSSWHTHPDEMGKKTGVRAICKMLPQFSNNDLLQEAISLDEKGEIGMQDNSQVFDSTAEEVAQEDSYQEPQSKPQEIAAMLGGR